MIATERPLEGGRYCATIEQSDQTNKKCSALPISHELISSVQVGDDTTHFTASIRQRGSDGRIEESSCTIARSSNNLLFTPEVFAAVLAVIFTNILLLIGSWSRGVAEKRRALGEWRAAYATVIDTEVATGRGLEPPINDAYLRGGSFTRKARHRILETITAELQGLGLEPDMPLVPKSRSLLVSRIKSVL